MSLTFFALACMFVGLKMDKICAVSEQTFISLSFIIYPSSEKEERRWKAGIFLATFSFYFFGWWLLLLSEIILKIVLMYKGK